MTAVPWPRVYVPLPTCGHRVWTFLGLSFLISKIGTILQTRERIGQSTFKGLALNSHSHSYYDVPCLG